MHSILFISTVVTIYLCTVDARSLQRVKRDGFSDLLTAFQGIFGGGSPIQGGKNVIVDKNKVGVTDGFNAFGNGYQNGGGVGYQNGTIGIGNGFGVQGLGKNIFGTGDNTNINLTPQNAGGCTGKNVGVLGANIFSNKNCVDLPIIGGLLGTGNGANGNSNTNSGNSFLDGILGFGGKK